MKDYMLIYKGGDPEWAQNTSKEEMEASMQRWGAWMESLAKKEQLVTGGTHSITPVKASPKKVLSLMFLHPN